MWRIIVIKNFAFLFIGRYTITDSHSIQSNFDQWSAHPFMYIHINFHCIFSPARMKQSFASSSFRKPSAFSGPSGSSSIIISARSAMSLPIFEKIQADHRKRNVYILDKDVSMLDSWPLYHHVPTRFVLVSSSKASAAAST